MFLLLRFSMMLNSTSLSCKMLSHYYVFMPSALELLSNYGLAWDTYGLKFILSFTCADSRLSPTTAFPFIEPILLIQKLQFHCFAIALDNSNNSITLNGQHLLSQKKDIWQEAQQNPWHPLPSQLLLQLARSVNLLSHFLHSQALVLITYASCHSSSLFAAKVSCHQGGNSLLHVLLLAGQKKKPQPNIRPGAFSDIPFLCLPHNTLHQCFGFLNSNAICELI